MSETIKILVIDDSEDDCLLYRRVLKKCANTIYTVTETDDGERGIALIVEIQPNCVLLDYSMPGRNGLEVLKRIRSKSPFVPVVMLTGQGNEAVAVSAMQEGAQNYIAKSNITSESLERVIRVAIEYCDLQRRIHEQRTSLEIFTRALAHDLKEPVRTILSFLDLLTRNTSFTGDAKEYMNYIQNAARRMNTLIDTVYFYTRLEGGGEIQQEACELNKVFEAAKENIVQLIQDRQAVVTHDPLPKVHANLMQVIQVFQNLLCNAIHHSDKIPYIHVSAEEQPTQWLFRVTDNGPGIVEEFREKVFKPFKRLSLQGEKGLGLGLAICEKIIHSHHGKIWFESELGKGTTFLFTIPKLADEIARVVPTTNNSSERTTPTHGTLKKVASLMIVDDNKGDIELSKIMIINDARLECGLLTAGDGLDALDQINTTPVDLMLLDINMPGMDGFELLERMKANGITKKTAVVMCTTSSYDKDMERAEALGAAGYLVKPADFSKLKPIIEKISNLELKQQGAGVTLFREEPNSPTSL